MWAVRGPFGHGSDTAGSPEHHLYLIPIDAVDESLLGVPTGTTVAGVELA